jgi:hypothetical protein
MTDSRNVREATHVGPVVPYHRAVEMNPTLTPADVEDGAAA